MHSWILIFGAILLASNYGCQALPTMEYEVSFPDAASHRYHVLLKTSGWEQDTLTLKMPAWMPGYYQYMHYAENVESLAVNNGTVTIIHPNENTWQIIGVQGQPIELSYNVMTQRRFVANSYVDSLHAYLIPENTFLYVDGRLDLPVEVTIRPDAQWPDMATGLDRLDASGFVCTAPDFDLLYDCPILLGDLEEFPSFEVRGIKHRFMAYQPGPLNSEQLMQELQKIIEASVEIFDDIPYHEYTFIGIGPGRGGIEHLNNTTVGFTGEQLGSESGHLRMLNFLAHEYFHHYNVKRIRPYELGPFDYDKGSKTNLLWISEGLSVYYEYLTVRRAGLVDTANFLRQFAGNIKATEEDPGLPYQSLAQASYATWQDGPFGGDNSATDRAISYYEKGPVVGLILDFTIRHATQNQKSLDDVMRALYWKYYKDQIRGFTDAEFQQSCEEVAGIPLDEFFEYVYTTKPLDYTKYLGYGGLQLIQESREVNPAETEYRLIPMDHMNDLQKQIYQDWLR